MKLLPGQLGKTILLFSFLTAMGAMRGPQSVAAAEPAASPLITESIDENHLVALSGNTRREAVAANDRGVVSFEFPMDHMLLQLRRSPQREQALQEYIDELEDPKSPNYHRWLTAQEVGLKYGLAAQDLTKITGWLRSHGFTVDQVYPNGMVIDFSGTAGRVTQAFHTEIHHLEVSGKSHFANMTNPEIPVAIAPAVVGVASLNDFHLHPQSQSQPDYTYSCGNGNCYGVVPADLATIYNLNPLFAAGISGQGQTVVAVEDTDVYFLGDWNTFRTSFGLSTAFPAGSVSQIHPGGCTDPGVVPGAESEATLDAEWASASAPSASIVLASCEDAATPGPLLALENLLNSSSTPPAIVSISYGEAETLLGAAQNSAINSLYQTAVLQGVSVFVATGDASAAIADQPSVNQGLEPVASHGVTVNGLASTAYNVAVGGTDFGDTYAGTNSKYWSATDGTTYGSALSYVPEIPWNDSCASGLIAAFEGFPSTYGAQSLCNAGLFLNITGGGGGFSGCATGAPSIPGVVSGPCVGYPKPAWQSILGNPNDGVRDLPDVSLFAANGVWGHSYLYYDSDPAKGGFASGGGTSFASPIMAGIQALVNQHTGGRQGNPNPVYYSLASTEYGSSGSADCNSTLGNKVASSCTFYDVTLGDNDVPCTGTNCYAPSGTYGVLSTVWSLFEPAFPAATGWDFATGIGTVNAYNLVMAFGGTGPTSTPTATPTASSTPTPTGTPTLTPTPAPTPTAAPTPTPAPPPPPTPTPTPTPRVSASVSVSKGFLSFGTVKVGRSKVKGIALTNTAKKKGGATITFNGGIFSGSSEFSASTNCNGQVAPKGKCSLTVGFAPTSPGAATATITISGNANNSPQTIGVAGTGR